MLFAGGEYILYVICHCVLDVMHSLAHEKTIFWGKHVNNGISGFN